MSVGLLAKLVQRATVYTSGSTGIFDVVARSDLPVKLAKVSTEGAGTARAELLARRRLIWGPDYDMPPNAQVEVGGHRWNFDGGDQAIGTYGDFGGTARYKASDVVRAD